jgi:Flp pilus assembly protein TadG
MRYLRESKFRSNNSGAIAASYALALPALIAIAAVGFDYARFAGMDSELQNAADQAALAAVSQLDGKAEACKRASAAAVGLVANQSLLASGDNAVTITPQESCSNQTGSIKFYSKVVTAGGVVTKTPATDDADARFAEVTVDARRVDYALLPVVMPGQSANITGIALAGLGSALCKLPPLMMCNPAENTGDADFTTANYIGVGIRLVASGGGEGYAPGVFGFLETGAPGANVLGQTLGRENPPGDCISATGVTPKTGANASVLDDLNTRFDIYANGLGCGLNDSLCPPSANSRKDLMKPVGNGNNACAIGGKGWQEGPNPYRPTSAVNQLGPTVPLDPMGYPRDMCHAVSNTGSCIKDRIGTGDWDRNAYFRSNSGIWPGGRPSDSTFRSDGKPPTRYDVYKYEYANGKMGTQSVGSLRSAGTPLCQPLGTPVGGTANNADRRVVSVAVINCGGPPTFTASSSNFPPLKFVDAFLTEPSADRDSGPSKRTDKTDIYVEIIGNTTTASGASAGQVIRKDTPYLIE